MPGFEMLLRLAYVANLAILAPVLFALHRERASAMLQTFNGAVANSDGLRQLVMSLWFAIAACSAFGLIWPRVFMPVLLLQVFYKSAWVLGFVLPRWHRFGMRAVPWGVALTFVVIILIWPVLLVQAIRW